MIDALLVAVRPAYKRVFKPVRRQGSVIRQHSMLQFIILTYSDYNHHLTNSVSSVGFNDVRHSLYGRLADFYRYSLFARALHPTARKPLMPLVHSGCLTVGVWRFHLFDTLSWGHPALKTIFYHGAIIRSDGPPVSLTSPFLSKSKKVRVRLNVVK